MGMKLIFLQIFAIIIIIFILRSLFQTHLTVALKKLKQLQEKNMIKESQLREELERAQKEKESEIQKGKEEAVRIIEEARRTGEIIKRNFEDQAHQENEKILQEGKENMKHFKKELIDKTQAQTIDVSLKLIKYILTTQVQERVHQELVGEIIEDIEDIEKNKFSIKENKVNVVTSYPLEQKDRDRLKNILLDKLDCSIEMREEVNPEIIGGIIVEIGPFVIDGSLKNKLQKAISLVKKDITTTN